MDGESDGGMPKNVGRFRVVITGTVPNGYRDAGDVGAAAARMVNASAFRDTATIERVEVMPPIEPYALPPSPLERLLEEHTPVLRRVAERYMEKTGGPNR